MIKSKLTVWIKKWLCKNVVYYNQKPYRLALNSQQQFTLHADNSQLTHTALIQIIGRAHYTEQNENYPLSNKKELVNLIKINQQASASEPGGHSAYVINTLGSDQSKVTHWQFTPLPKAWLNLPETLLLSHTLAPAQVINSQAFTPMYVTEHQRSVFSALTSSLINSPERFAAMFGIPCQQVTSINEPAHFAQTLVKGLKAQPIGQLASFFSLPAGLVTKAQLKITGAIIGALFIAYGALTSGYLLYKTHTLTAQLEQNKSSVNQALTTLTQFQTTSDKLATLQAFTNNQQLTSSVFFVLQELLTSAELSNIRYEDGRYILRGTADKATNALQVIINNSRVNNAKFDYPSRKERRGESFVISFTLNTLQDQATPAANPSTKEAD